MTEEKAPEKKEVIVGKVDAKAEKKSGGKGLLIVLIILLFLGNLALGWLYYQEKQESHIVYVKLKDANAEKEYIQKNEKLKKALIALKNLTDRIDMTMKKLDNVEKPVSKEYIKGITMLDIKASSELSDQTDE